MQRADKHGEQGPLNSAQVKHTPRTLHSQWHYQLRGKSNNANVSMKEEFIFVSSGKEKILLSRVSSYLPFDFSHVAKKRKTQ